jgi:hypothetical protein
MLLTRLKLRLARWWKRLIGRLPDAAAINRLPFEPDELARLIRRGRREDFEKLVAGFSKRSTGGSPRNLCKMDSVGIPILITVRGETLEAFELWGYGLDCS